jgi:putative copper export protein
VLLGGVRLSHALAAALWVGGALVCALSPGGSGQVDASWAGLRNFREALRIAIGVFVVSGALLSVERLGSAPLPPTYFGILVVKIGLGVWMFAVARHIGVTAVPSGGSGFRARAEHQVVVLGVVIYGLALVLRSIYEDALRP